MIAWLECRIWRCCCGWWCIDIYIWICIWGIDMVISITVMVVQRIGWWWGGFTTMIIGSKVEIEFMFSFVGSRWFGFSFGVLLLSVSIPKMGVSLVWSPPRNRSRTSSSLSWLSELELEFESPTSPSFLFSLSLSFVWILALESCVIFIVDVCWFLSAATATVSNDDSSVFSSSPSSSWEREWLM